MRIRARAALALVPFLVVASACSHAASAKPITFGAASASPPVVKVGTSFVVTPAGVVDRECADIAHVYKAVEGMPPYVQLGIDGGTAPLDGPNTSWPACYLPPSARSVTYHIGADFPIGSFVLCLNSERSPNGCATFRTAKG